MVVAKNGWILGMSYVGMWSVDVAQIYTAKLTGVGTLVTLARKDGEEEAGKIMFGILFVYIEVYCVSIK